MLKNIEYNAEGKYTYDGAGVKLKRILANNTIKVTDPFLLLDNFGSKEINDYIKGFPWHPHRGIETVTYVLNGKVEHRDSEDNSGTIYKGDVQWMTSGSGIFHEEMPEYIEDENKKIIDTYMSGFQLWVNLPANRKMTTPVYRSIKSKDIPEIEDNNVKIKVISGKYKNIEGPYNGGTQEVSYYHVKMENESSFIYKTRNGFRTIMYLINGNVKINNKFDYKTNTALIFSTEGDEIDFNAIDYSEFIIVSGKPLNEPIAWYGPIVMNTYDQINEAINDLNNNNFVREKHPLIK